MADTIATGSAEQRRAGWRLIRREIKRQKAGLLLGIGASLAWTVGKVAIPQLVSMAIDRAIRPATPGHHSALGMWVVLILIAGVIAAVFTGLRRYMAFREARLTETNLREQIFAHIQRLHFAFHDGSQTGQLMSRANSDLQQIQSLIVNIPITVGNATIVAATTVILFTTNVKLAVLALMSLPFLNVVARKFFATLHPAVMGIQATTAEVAMVVEETVSGVRVIKGFGTENVQSRKLAARADGVFRTSMEATNIRGNYLPAMELLPSIGIILVLAYGGHLVINGQLTLGELVKFQSYVILLVWPLRMMGTIIAQAQRSAASAERVEDILTTEVEVVDPPHPKRLPKPERRGAVRFEGVRFTYPISNADPVLDGFNLMIDAGTSVAVVGATGSGKTTIARLIPRFYDVDAGAVTIDGVDVRDLELRSLRRAVGIVFEDTFLFSDTIRANISFAYPNASIDDVMRAARLAGADEFIGSLSEGYDTAIGERGFSLSGGQRQRIAIARAILADPRILILDDATSSVDPTKEHEIRDALTEVMRGRTTIVIAHRPATIALADRVVLLDGHRIVADGRHEELLATNERYREVLASSEVGDAAYLPDGA